MSAELLHAKEWDTADIQRFVGLGLGRDEVVLYQFSPGTYVGTREFGFDTLDVARCFDYSPLQRELVGYGLNSGNAYIRELNAGGADNTIQLKSKATRRCNTLAFSTGHTVATGYEKTRQNDSLCIWDLNAESFATPALTVPTQDTVSTAKFVPDSPTSLVFGGSKHLSEFDTRSQTIVGSVPSAFCSRLEFSPLDPNLFASFGETNHVALWDRRMLLRNTQHTEPLLVMPHVFKDATKLDSRCVRFSLSNQSEFAVLQDSSTIRRWQTSCTPAAQKLHSHLSSGLRSESEHPQASSFSRSLSHSDAHPQIKLAEDERLAPHEILPPATATWDRSLFVNRVYDLKTSTDKVVSFDYSWNSGSCQPEFVCVRQSGAIYRMPICDPPSCLYFDPFNEFNMVMLPSELIVVSSDSGTTACDLMTKEVRVLDGPNETDTTAGSVSTAPLSGTGTATGTATGTGTGTVTPTATNTSGTRESRDSESDRDTSDEDKASDADSLHASDEEHADDGLRLDVILKNDITATMRIRALAGYSLDAAWNIALLTDPGSLALQPACQEALASLHSSGIGSSSTTAAWKWVRLQQELMNQPNNYLQTPEIDLRYIGVSSVWDGLSAESLQFRCARAGVSSKLVDDAVRYAVRRSPGSAYVSAGDDSNAYRQLGLRLAGWDFGLSELESRLLKLESEGKFEKAAGWAAFHNNVERAVESLAKSGKKNLRLMSTAVAGYLVYKDVPTNNVWREQCRRLASELSAPYLRAIFAYIADGSWLDVLDDGALPLTERLGIALRFLPQKKVGKYLATLTARAIAKGDLEGIILTGFTPRVLDLLQAYLDRSGDIQTVCLLASFAWPRFVDHPQFAVWFNEYRQLLNSWQYFSQRARLDIARNKLVSQYSNAAPPIMGQAYLKCSHCKNTISWETDRGEAARRGRAGKKQAAIAGADDGAPRESAWRLWNRCPSCNHQLPSCGVCANALGPCIDDEIESDRWPTFCLKCNHAFHSVHARQWFRKYDICPVPSCKCLCPRSVSTTY